MVTFQLFVILAIDVLSGAQARPLPLLEAHLADSIEEKAGLTHFLPARIQWNDGTPSASVLRWQGSGDISTLTQANCFLVVPTGRPTIQAGQMVSVLPRIDVL
jgi:molybdopterin molybdotransferase